jgi:hypothetical protein
MLCLQECRISTLNTDKLDLSKGISLDLHFGGTRFESGLRFFYVFILTNNKLTQALSTFHHLTTGHEVILGTPGSGQRAESKEIKPTNISLRSILIISFRLQLHHSSHISSDLPIRISTQFLSSDSRGLDDTKYSWIRRDSNS